jgi:hypothetical protein
LPLWRPGGNTLTVTGGQLVAEGEPVSGELRRGGRMYRVTGDGPAVLRCGDSAALRLMPGTVFQAGARSISGQAADLSVNEGALYVHMAPGARLALETARASVAAKGDFYLRVAARDAGIAGAGGLFAAHAAEAEEAMPAGPPADLLLVGFSGTVELKLPGGKTDRIGKNEVFIVSRDLPRERWGVDELIQHLRGEAQRLSWPKEGTPEWQELETYRKVVETYLLDSAHLTAVTGAMACDPQAAAPARDRLQRICRHLGDHLPKFGELKAKYGGRGQDPARARRMGELLDQLAGAHQGFADAGWWQEALRKEE